MLPRDTTIRQLKKLRAETKGTDIGDLTAGDRLNHNVPNLQYIGNPVDSHIESWEEFSKHDSQLQTIAFKSKLVNKPLVKENNKKIMEEKINNVLAFNDFNKNWEAKKAKKTKRTNVAKDIIKEDVKRYNKPGWEDPFFDTTRNTDYPGTEDDFDRDEIIDMLHNVTQFDVEELEEMSDEELMSLYDEFGLEDGGDFEEQDDFDDEDDLILDDEDEDENRLRDFDEEEMGSRSMDPDDLENDDLEENVQTFEAFTLKDAPEEKQPEYTMLGKEKELKSNTNFGIGAIKDNEIKKITQFNKIDPPTKERSILNAGQFVHTEKVRGYINRIEGSKVFVESLDEPMKIVEINIKDAVKPPIEVKEELKRFDEICIELNKEFLKNK